MWKVSVSEKKRLSNTGNKQFRTLKFGIKQIQNFQHEGVTKLMFLFNPSLWRRTNTPNVGFVIHSGNLTLAACLIPQDFSVWLPHRRDTSVPLATNLSSVLVTPYFWTNCARFFKVVVSIRIGMIKKIELGNRERRTKAR